MTETIIYTEHLTAVSCGECQIPFAIPADMLRKRQNDGKSFWCPNGCKISYGEGENARLRRHLASAQARETHARDQRQAAERSAAAYKGVATRVRKRAANGVCPCCNRTFANVARHMAGQHPGFQPGGDP